MRYQREFLVRAYLATLKSYVHEDFIIFYRARFEALQKLFAVELPPPGVFGMLFRGAARNYVTFDSTRAGWLEDSLLNRKLEELPDEGRAIREAEDRANHLTEQTREALFELMLAIFNATCRSSREFVTSEELLALGVDDSKEPNLYDYFDLL